MLLKRLITAIIFLAIFSISLFEVSAVYSSLFIAFLCLVCIYEAAKMYRFTTPLRLLLILNFILLNIFIYIEFFANITSLNGSYPLVFTHMHLIVLNKVILLISIIFWIGLVPCLLINKPFVLSKWVLYLVCICLFTFPLYSFILIHSIYGSVQLVSVIAVSWIADSGAYFIGKNFGRHKLAPQISPGKSVEGALGGIFFVFIYFILLKYFNLVSYLDSYTNVIVYSLVLSIFSIMGDLFESWLKRAAKVKDSGSILPGHGGLFDRLDSVIAVLAIFAVLTQIH